MKPMMENPNLSFSFFFFFFLLNRVKEHGLDLDWTGRLELMDL